jgi:hypothetical protein
MVAPSGEPDSHSLKPARKKSKNMPKCSPEKYAACIANSKKSTGPVSSDGKAAVTGNAKYVDSYI